MLAPELATGRLEQRSPAHTVAQCAAIAGVAAAVVAIVGIKGNFPLYDDWSYAYTTRALCEKGRLDLLPWSGSSLVLQAAYGALVCKAFGFSFAVLRATTLVAAVAGAVGFALLLRAARVHGPLAALALALFGLNPLYVSLAFTYMTDVPFVALLVWAAYLYALGLERGRGGPLLAASLACSAAVLVRQHGIFLAAAAFLACLVFPRQPMRVRARHALLAAFTPGLALAGVTAWMFLWRTPPAGAANRAAELAHLSPLLLANAAFRSLGYIGLFTAPLAFALARPLFGRRPKTVAACLALVAAGAAFLYAREGALMPYLTNVIYDFGLGPWTLRDVFFLGHEPPGHIGIALELPATVVCLAAAALLAASWIEHLGRLRDPREGFLVFGAFFLAAGALLQARLFLDRHLLPVVPLVLAASATARRACRPGPLAFGLAALLAWYSVAGTHDYMAWNRARWQLLERLEARGTSPERIDGGFEYNAWHLAARLGTWPTMAEARIGHPPSEKSWWWVIRDDYRVVSRPSPDEQAVDRADYPVLLAVPPRIGSVYLVAASPSPSRPR